MGETPPEEETKPPPPKRRARGGLRPIRLVAFLTMLLAAAVALTDRPLLMPDFVAEKAEDILRERTGLGVDLGSVVVEIRRIGDPEVTLRDITLSAPDGSHLGQVNSVSIALGRDMLMGGEVRPTALQLSGAQLTLRRSAEGAFAIQTGGEAALLGDLPTIVAAATDLFDLDALTALRVIFAHDLTVTLEDARSSQIWQGTGGRVNLRNTPETLQINVFSELFDGSDDLSQVQLSVIAQKDEGSAAVTARIADVPARDIALQAPALAFLGALDAPVSGALRTQIAGDGTVGSLDGTLDLGAGALQPTEGARPVPFNAAKAYFSYDPSAGNLAFSEVSVKGRTLNITGKGHAYLRDYEGIWPNTLLAQVSLSEFQAAPEGVFSEAITFDEGYADFRLRLDPFSIEFGQVVLEDETMRVDGRGAIAAGEAGWSGGAHLSTPETTPRQILSLWPVRLGPQTRGWISNNLQGGTLAGVEAAFRLQPGDRPNFGFTFNYTGADVRFLPDMPHVTEGAGHASLNDKRFSITVSDGGVPTPKGLTVDISGTSFQVVDVFAEPGIAKIDLQLEAPVSAVLEVLDNPPFRVLEALGHGSDVIEATVSAEGEAEFPLEKDLLVADVDFRVAGRMSGAKTEQIVPGKLLASDSLGLEIEPNLLKLSGDVAFDGLPLEATLRQPLGQGPEGPPGVVDGTIELSPETLSQLGIDLPDWISGRGQGDFSIELNDGGPPNFRLTSDLAGLRIEIQELGWVKPPGDTGSLEIAGQLGDDPSVDVLRLDAPGLALDGALVLEDGRFVAADFANVTAGNWLDAPIRLESRGAGAAPRVLVQGGQVDLFRKPDTPGSGGVVPLTLSLDTLRVTEGITLTNVEGEIVAGRALNGEVRARVGGGPGIRVNLVPQEAGTALRIRGPNAGAIMRNAGLFQSLHDGTLDISMIPAEGEGGFEGQLEIDNAFLRGQSVVVDMLDAVSVVGILDQLQGPGVKFDKIEGRFRLTEDRLTVTRSSAVGASLGISLDGTYDIADERLDMQGVMSPIYLLNAIGQVFTRRGEGLFGFTFRIQGTAEDPRIGVNPLSILTPGMFREIFRRAPPE